jgi:hypothetical protein
MGDREYAPEAAGSGSDPESPGAPPEYEPAGVAPGEPVLGPENLIECEYCVEPEEHGEFEPCGQCAARGGSGSENGGGENGNGNETLSETTYVLTSAVWEAAPEKFRDIPFPEFVPFTDSLKINLGRLSRFTTKDFSRSDFYIATTETGIFRPGSGGGLLDDARRYRTLVAETVCNMQIVSLERQRESIARELRNSIDSGDFFADILCVPLDAHSAMIANGSLMNMRKVPFLDFGEDYYNASATEAFTVNGNVFGMISDLVFDPSNMYAVFYNRSLAKKYNIADPLEIYKNGGWNYDAMFAVSKELAASIAGLDSDPRWSIGFDPENDGLLNGLFVSSGNKYFIGREYASPILNFSNERTRRLISAVSNILNPAVIGTHANEDGSLTEIMEFENYLVPGSWDQNTAFSNGNVLFSFLSLDMITKISDSDFDWGILPVPAPEAGGDIYSFADNNSLGIAVPAGAFNTEASGLVTAVLSLASHTQLKEVYISEMMRHYLRDVDSVIILDKITRGLTFNQFNAFSSIPEIRNTTVGILRGGAADGSNLAELHEGGLNTLDRLFRNSQIFVRR